MVIRMGLSAAEQAAFERLLVSHHSISIRMYLLDLDHNEIVGGDVSKRFMSGQVTVDTEAEIWRSLSVDLLDPTGALHLDSNSPDSGAMFADRMLRVTYSIVNPTNTARYTVPLFTGPITKLERNGVFVGVECQGKEVFGMQKAWNAKSYSKGTLTTNVIRNILSGFGEAYMDIPSLDNRLPYNVSVGSDRTPWQVARGLAGSLGYVLYYDGNGVATMRKVPTSPIYTFSHNTSLKTEPSVGFSMDNVVNAVEVFGKVPTDKKGQTKKKQPHARVVADRNHPFSPWSLGRAAGPRYLPLVIEEDSIETDVQALNRAKQELKSRLLEAVDVAYDALPAPHLEEWDVVNVTTPRFATTHRYKKFTIPLNSSGSSSIGYIKNVKPSLLRASKKPHTKTKKR